MPDFSSYLTVDADSIPKTMPSLPRGHFFASIQPWKTGERQYQPGSKTPVVELVFKITGADEDIETADLPEGGGVGRIISKDYTLNDPEKRGQIQLRRVAEVACLLELKGHDLESVLNSMVGCDVRVFNDPRPSKTDPEQFYNNITMILPTS